MSNKESKNSQYPLIYGPMVSILAFAFSEAIAYVYSSKDSKKLYFMVFFIFLIQWIGFIFASGILGNTPTEKYYDITGSFTYILVLVSSFLTLKKMSTRQLIIILASLIWSIRLGVFLFARISRSGGIDKRFSEIKTSFSDFLIAWSIQGLWILMTLLSVLAACQIEDTEELAILNYLGILTWIIGFTFEVVADYQKSVFKKNPDNQNKWISSGLWSVSRHPNYFGEIFLWIGISLICYSKSINPLKLVLSPIFVACLLIFVSGIPILEKNANLRYEKNKEYEKYKKNTPVLIPFIGRAGDSRF